MSRKFKFEVGEKILCYDGRQIYVAKCLKTEETEDKGAVYFVHYVGWNKRWDTWLPENQVLKYNRNNLRKQAELKLAHNAKSSELEIATKSAKKSKSESNSGSKDSDSDSSLIECDVPDPSMQSKEQVLKNEVKGENTSPNTPGEENSPSSTSSAVVPVNEPNELHLDENCDLQTFGRIEVKIVIPDELKECLIVDRDLVCNQKKLMILPQKPNILEIFTSYLLNKRMSCPSNWSGDNSYEMVRGLEDYFDVVLNTQLLYNIERPQYEDIIKQSKADGVPLCCLYGGIHLLRLFVKLGSLLSYWPTDPNSVQRVIVQLEDLLQYLATNRSVP